MENFSFYALYIKIYVTFFSAIKKQQKNVSDVTDFVHGSLLWVFTVFAGYIKKIT